jgi:hypothetical protein
MSLTVKIRGDASHFDKTIGSVNKGMSQLGIGIAAVGAAATAAAGVAALKFIDFAKSASQAASGVESLKMQFEVLLGSADAAGKRIEEITRFAASTPFEVDELARTSKLLQTLGGTLLATGEGLRMVGDATAIAGQPIEEMGLHIGRLFNALTSGTSAGEAVARLQEVGLITGVAKNQFEALAAAQKKGTQPILTQNQALTLLQNVMSQTSGAMAKLSATTEGKLSNMADAVSQFKVAFGTGLNEGVRAGAEAMSKGLSSMQNEAEQAGKTVGALIANAVNGDFELLIETGKLIGSALLDGMKLSFQVAGGEVLAQLGGVMDKYTEIGQISKAMGNKPLEELIRGSSRGVVSDNFEVAVFEITEAARELREKAKADAEFKTQMKELFAAGSRPGSPGNTPQMDAMLRQLERIANSVDQTFPN